jgi:predicted ATPase
VWSVTNVEFRRGAQPFVGRGPELDVLSSAFSDAAEGNGGAVFVVGDPGIGKTRLVDEFTDRCHSTTGSRH